MDLLVVLPTHSSFYDYRFGRSSVRIRHRHFPRLRPWFRHGGGGDLHGDEDGRQEIVTPVPGPIDCAVCGFDLGTGVPGGSKYCGRCEQYVLTKAKQGNPDALGGLVILGLAVVAGLAVVGFVASLFDR